MCVYSMISDFYGEQWQKKWDHHQPQTLPPPLSPFGVPYPPLVSPPPPPQLTEQEVDDVRRLLERAKEYDRVNGEPECQLETKKQKLKELAKAMGIEVDFP